MKINSLINKNFFVIFILIFVSINYLYKCEQSGFGENYDENNSVVTEKVIEGSKNGIKTITKKTTITKHESAKTLWNWMELFLAPATLALLGFWFQSKQEEAKISQENADKEAATKKADLDRKQAIDQQHEYALQDYLNNLSELLVDKQLLKQIHLNKISQEDSLKSLESAISEEILNYKFSKIDAEIALDLIKARTLSLLRLFYDDIPRKASVLCFLGDAGLLTKLDLELAESILTHADLRRANMSGVDFFRSDLSFTDLRSADLCLANLSNAKLIEANLSGANLSRAYLSLANLNGANLNGTNLSLTNLNGADLSGANFSGTYIKNADLKGANLQGIKNYSLKQLQSAKNWQTARYDTETKINLGLNIENAL